MVWTAEEGSVSERLSILRTKSLLPWAVGRDLRSSESGAEGLRTVAMTVWLGRARYVLAKLLPIPDCVSGLEEGDGMALVPLLAPVMRTVVAISARISWPWFVARDGEMLKPSL